MNTSILARTIFTDRVRTLAATTIDNQHAGCTDDETHFIDLYFKLHPKQGLAAAIEQCAMTMLERYRSSEIAIH